VAGTILMSSSSCDQKRGDGDVPRGMFGSPRLSGCAVLKVRKGSVREEVRGCLEVANSLERASRPVWSKDE